jgi:hypothetical protein
MDNLLRWSGSRRDLWRFCGVLQGVNKRDGTFDPYLIRLRSGAYFGRNPLLTKDIGPFLANIAETYPAGDIIVETGTSWLRLCAHRRKAIFRQEATGRIAREEQS